ncbi:MAG: IS1380 family transposase, partial [Desulfobacterales bacterium]|nr:IS1380 family transposase [Desulfobacterales bacterium]
MPEFDIEFTDEAISSNAGLLLIGSVLCSNEFKEQIITVSNDESKDYSDYDIIKSYLGLLSLGKSDYESIDDYRNDRIFKQCLDLKLVPSKETLRQRLEFLSKPTVNKAIEAFNVQVVKRYSVLQTCKNTNYIPIDFDVSPFDNSRTKKKGVSRTYKKHDGYAPMLTYIGGTGFMLNNELREGKAHSNCVGTANYIRSTLSYSKALTDNPCLARFDSGNDSIENIFVVNEFENINYLIKGNMRTTPKDDFIQIAHSDGAEIDNPRLGKKVYYNSKLITLEQKNEQGEIQTVQTRRIVRLIERTTDNKGQYFLEPKMEIDFWNTDLFYLSEKEIIALYSDHGTSEQFHSEFKTDMDLERFPSGKFETNSLIITLGMLTFNLLRLIGQQMLTSGELKRKRPVKRIRIRKVIQNVMYMSCKFMIRYKR